MGLNSPFFVGEWQIWSGWEDEIDHLLDGALGDHIGHLITGAVVVAPLRGGGPLARFAAAALAGLAREIDQARRSKKLHLLDRVADVIVTGLGGLFVGAVP